MLQHLACHDKHAYTKAEVQEEQRLDGAEERVGAHIRRPICARAQPLAGLPLQQRFENALRLAAQVRCTQQGYNDWSQRLSSRTIRSDGQETHVGA